MNEEEIRKIIDDTYDESKEDTIRSIVSDLYSRKTLSVIIVFWIWIIFFYAALIFSGIKFFKTEEVQFQIMYSTIFTCCILGISILKVMAWQMAHRHGIKREIKRLELRIAELNEIVTNK